MVNALLLAASSSGSLHMVVTACDLTMSLMRCVLNVIFPISTACFPPNVLPSSVWF